MREVNLMGFFQKEDAAQAAAQELKNMEFETVQVSEFSPFPGENASDLDNPISEPMDALAREVMEASLESPDEAILAATMPDASGMADGERHHSMENWLVTVVAPEAHHEKAKQVLKRHGARI